MGKDDQHEGGHATPPPFDPRTRCIKTRGGKLYLPVAERVKWLNADREAQGYEITVEMNVVYFDADRAAVQATVTIPGRGTASNVKSEVRPGLGGQTGFGNYLEKAATGAIGRCLALLGYGTEYALELHDEDMQEGGDVSAAVDTPREDKARVVSTSAGGLTTKGGLVAKAGAALGEAAKAAGTAGQRTAQANAEIKRLAREHGFAPPTSYGALVKLAQDHYDYTLPKVASAQQIAPEVLEKFVAHMKSLGGDPQEDQAEEKTEEQTDEEPGQQEEVVVPSPFDQAPAPGAAGAREEIYARAVGDLRRALEAYDVVAQLDDVVALVRQLRKEGCLRAEDALALEDLHRERVRTVESRQRRGA
jgi:hypothetical protein